VRAVLDLVSKQDDPLLTWTEYPWVYLQYHRVAATRWIWKSFMLGQIYLGRSGPQYVLPKTWEWFADDMKQSNPAVFLEETALPVTQGNPFATYVNNNFTKVYAGSDNNIYLRDDEMQAVIDGTPGSPFRATVPLGPLSHWTVGSGTASLPSDSPPSATDVLALSNSLCTRISGTYAANEGGSGSFLSFRFESSNPTTKNARLNIAGTQIFSGDDGAVYDSVNLVPPTEATAAVDAAATAGTATTTGAPAAPAADPAAHSFALVVGKSSAALVIDGMIRAAVRLTDQTRVSLEVRNGGVALTNLTKGPPPPDSGC
jgi:hypothetical protein